MTTATDWTARLAADGYAIIPDVIDRDTVASLAGDLAPVFDATPVCEGDFYGRRTKRFGRLLLRSAHADALVRHPLILQIVDAMLRPWCDRFDLNLTQGVEIGAGALAQYPHRDQDMWGGAKGEIEYLVNVIWPLTRFTEANGATVIWPGSHRRQAEASLPLEDAVAAEMQPGDALLFLGSTLHGGGANRTKLPRRGIIVRLLSSRDRFSAYRSRRVVVKTRLARLGGKGIGVARAHLRYIQRDRVTHEGAPGQLYSAEKDTADGKAFLERCGGDRHQFRFIVSAEDGVEYQDLKPFVRRLMGRMEEDLGTSLDWVAVDHFNTGHPHSHIVLRGVDDQGKNLIIAREYISHGIRERAAELATLDLGPRTDQEIEAKLRLEIGEDRLTSVDRRLIREMDADRTVSSAHTDPFQQSLRAGRLQKLASLGLADAIGGGRWQLADGLEETLRRLAERSDVIRIMQWALKEKGLSRPWLDRAEFMANDPEATPLVGRVVMRGLADEHRDRHYLIVDGVDGHVHYVDLGLGDHVGPMAEGAIVRVSGRGISVRDSDRTVAEVAAANGGRYSIDLHLRHDPTATEAFAATHVRRLEAIRRATGGIERESDGTWIIAANHADRVSAYEARWHRDNPVAVEVLSPVPLAELSQADAATWLDRELASDAPLVARNAGFGREIREALATRRQWLIEQELAEGDGARARLRAGVLAILQRRELLRVAGDLSGELGKGFVEATSGGRVEGILRRRVDLVSGRYALIERSKEFTLVPWRPVLDRQLGKDVAGIVRSGGINWQFGRGKGQALPDIS